MSKQGALTNWRPQREAQVRTWNGSKQVMGAYHLETTGGGTSQDMERK